MARKLFIKAYGCQMNVYDAERMAGVMVAEGYEQTDTPDDADLIVLNTCHIREKAAEKVYSELGRLKRLKDLRPDLKIGVAGCVAQAEGAEIQRRQSAVDFVVGPQAYHRLPKLVRDGGVDTEFPVEDKFSNMAPALRRRSPSAFLTVQEGCDKFCAFCVVPYTRGAEVSRPAARLIDEAKALADQGVREITLLGQNVNAYHGAGPDGGDWTLARLLEALAGIEGIARLRYTTSHPNDMGDDLIEAHAGLAKLMPYLHLPVQSGSDRILKAMNRRHTADAYLRLIDRIRAARPDIALSGDFIVGFPGETEADFQATLDLCAAVGYGSAYSFKYSSRPGTPAAGAGDQAPEAVMTERLHRLQARIESDQKAFQVSMVGRTLPVLVEKAGRMPGQMVGKSPWLHAVHFDAGPEIAGQVVEVEVIASAPNSLSGRLA